MALLLRDKFQNCLYTTEKMMIEGLSLKYDYIKILRDHAQRTVKHKNYVYLSDLSTYTTLARIRLNFVILLIVAIIAIICLLEIICLLGFDSFYIL